MDHVPRNHVISHARGCLVEAARTAKLLSTYMYVGKRACEKKQQTIRKLDKTLGEGATSVSSFVTTKGTRHAIDTQMTTYDFILKDFNHDGTMSNRLMRTRKTILTSFKVVSH